MDIKGIDPYRAQFERSSDVKEVARPQTQVAEKNATTSSGDKISLSPEARLRAEALSAATNAPDIRQDKVAALKAQVESGEYQVDSKNIAAKLIQEETELF